MAAGCVLRASGASFVVKEFLAGGDLKPCKVWMVGDVRFGQEPTTDAGFNLVTSDGEELAAQIVDTTEFLERNRKELSRLAGAVGVEDLILDFALPRREVAAQFVRFPAAFVKLVGECGMVLEVSLYG